MVSKNKFTSNLALPSARHTLLCDTHLCLYQTQMSVIHFYKISLLIYELFQAKIKVSSDVCEAMLLLRLRMTTMTSCICQYFSRHASGKHA